MNVPTRSSSSGRPSSFRAPPAAAAAAAPQSRLAQNMARSMTIDEMRQLHQRALHDAEAKRTELRLVLASRYRELVGSSDEVIKMKERAHELHDLVKALPSLLEKLTQEAPASEQEPKEAIGKESSEELEIAHLRRDLSLLPRVAYRALDVNDVHTATAKLMELFTLIASQTDVYPLANALSTKPARKARADLDPALDAQMRMIFLQVQTLPGKISRIASRHLVRPASYGRDLAVPSLGAQKSAAALATLDFLSVDQKEDRAERLLSVYFDSKAKLMGLLLSRLSAPEDGEGANNAEQILSKIVLILQFDIVVHPYQIFVLRNFQEKSSGDAAKIMNSMPLFDPRAVKARCSQFLATHLPLIRTKVKSVLVTIAGTTASALGQIRQSLYDKTDGAESMERLNKNGVCTWDDAVAGMIDVRTVHSSADGGGADGESRFSLWGTLFSNTFSSLVHSLLTTSFQSVHTRVVSTLRTSLASAPPVNVILPHEAYRNTLKIATDLDEALLKVSDDAHELLVHAEERVESERRLRQSLYVQTCEIMGRLLCELRRIVGENDGSDAAKELIIGRLCFLLKFRLTSLPTLLNPDSSPASMHSTIGMISYVDLQSAFELADDNDNGMISFDDALQAVESAFSGTPFHGAEMVRETLLISDEAESTPLRKGASSGTPSNFTLSELTLLTARGLRHAKSGAESALGTVQTALDGIVNGCFEKWASSSLSVSATSFDGSLRDLLLTATTVSEEEWRRLYSSSDGSTLQTSASTNMSVSPHVVGYLLGVSSLLNRNTCPSDSLSPVPGMDYATSLGIGSQSSASVPTLLDTMRWALICQSFSSLASMLEKATMSEAASNLGKSCLSALVQLHVDVSFIRSCFMDHNRVGFGPGNHNPQIVASATKSLESVVAYTNKLVNGAGDRTIRDSLLGLVDESSTRVAVGSNLFFSSLFGDDKQANVSAAGELMGGTGGAEPLFHAPLSSSRRFVLLPVQADRSLSAIQLRIAEREREEATVDRPETTSGNVISSGFGYLSSMLKKK